MLDLTKIARQIPGISQHLTVEAAASRQRLELAQTLLLQTNARQDELVKRQQQWRDRMTFTAATPVEPLDTRVDLSTAPKATPSLPQMVLRLPRLTTKSPIAI
jgi:hypothetical protein